MSYPKELLELWKKAQQAAGPSFDDCYPRLREALQEIEAILGPEIEIMWDKDRDQEEMCDCGHPYYRHFDSYEDMAPIGCKYCPCFTFKKKE